MGEHIINGELFEGVRERVDTCNCDYIRAVGNETQIIKVIHKCKSHESVLDSNITNEVISHNHSWQAFFKNNNITDTSIMGKVKSKEKENSEKLPAVANTNAKKMAILNSIQ